jgi:hypothetical protein
MPIAVIENVKGSELPVSWLEKINKMPDKLLKITVEVQSTDDKKEKIHKLISNNHVWSEDDIQAVEQGKEIINKWKIS